MYFKLASRDLDCNFCEGVIERGSPYAILYYMNKRDRPVRYSFHIDCGRERVVDVYDAAYFRYQNSFDYKPKLGRPRKYKNPKNVKRVKSLISYHKAKGNWDKVEELVNQLPKGERAKYGHDFLEQS